MRRWWAFPLTPLYWLGAGGKDLLFRWGMRRVRWLRWPVISVGSLSAGGAGKTPVVLMLAELLGRHGVAVDVLSRGYGRGSGVVEEVDRAGPASRFGDEPMEMARAGVQVFVGADRYAAGRVAEQSPAGGSRALEPADPSGEVEAIEEPGTPAQSAAPGARMHLLDDGFQHRRLGRDLDVVLLTLRDARDWLLPAGNLREGLAALRRADVLVLRDDEAEALRPLLDRRAAQAKRWVIRRELVLPAELPRRPVVFCAIARPDGLLRMLEERGVEVAGTALFPDHHAYRQQDFRRLLGAAERSHADGFVTTAKDAVKISAGMRALLEGIGPLCVAGLRVTLADEAAALQTLREAAGRR